MNLERKLVLVNKEQDRKTAKFVKSARKTETAFRNKIIKDNRRLNKINEEFKKKHRRILG